CSALGAPALASSPFPYTTLFRSERLGLRGARGRLPCLRHAPRPLASRRALAPAARRARRAARAVGLSHLVPPPAEEGRRPRRRRSEEHTSELQSRGHLVCRLLLE